MSVRDQAFGFNAPLLLQQELIVLSLTRWSPLSHEPDNTDNNVPQVTNGKLSRGVVCIHRESGTYLGNLLCEWMWHGLLCDVGNRHGSHGLQRPRRWVGRAIAKKRLFHCVTVSRWRHMHVGYPTSTGALLVLNPSGQHASRLAMNADRF